MKMDKNDDAVFIDGMTLDIILRCPNFLFNFITKINFSCEKWILKYSLKIIQKYNICKKLEKYNQWIK